MSGPNPKDFFSSFLATADGAPDKAGSEVPQEAAGMENMILQFLSAREGPVSVREMLASLSVAPSLMMEALKRLTDAKLVDVHRIESDDCVVLSDLGRRVSA